MKKQSVFTLILGTIIFSLVFGYSLVFASVLNEPIPTNISFILSDNIYLDSLSLKKTKILFKSSDNLEEYKIKSTCNIFSKLTYSKGNYYMFDLKFFDNKCEDKDFQLINESNGLKYDFKLHLLTEYSIYSKMLDLKTTRLIQLKDVLNKKISKYSDFAKYDRNIESNYYVFLKKNRVLNEAIYNKKIINNILEKRGEKYIVPVLGHKIPHKHDKLPNSGRGYRGDYTDGIHHGWDIDGKFGENVVALDDSIVVRVVSGFEFSDLNEIKRGNNLSEDDKIKNLDILRGNQIWLKTMSGDVVMYSHLDDIYSNVEVGEFVRKGSPLGTIGITGIPDKSYTDFHLHFTIHVNPFNLKKNESYDYDDYMRWDWLFKGESHEYILENWNRYFES